MAARYFIGRLIPRRSQRNVKLTIKYTSELPSNWQASCDNYFDTEGKDLREYKIEVLPDMSRALTIKALAHELCHVKQRLLKEHKLLDGNESIWKKKRYDEEEHNYRDLPWEREAFGVEKRLYNSYMKWRKRHR